LSENFTAGARSCARGWWTKRTLSLGSSSKSARAILAMPRAIQNSSGEFSHLSPRISWPRRQRDARAQLDLRRLPARLRVSLGIQPDTASGAMHPERRSDFATLEALSRETQRQRERERERERKSATRRGKKSARLLRTSDSIRGPPSHSVPPRGERRLRGGGEERERSALLLGLQRARRWPSRDQTA